jgi:hypothetical protein
MKRRHGSLRCGDSPLSNAEQQGPRNACLGVPQPPNPHQPLPLTLNSGSPKARETARTLHTRPSVTQAPVASMRSSSSVGRGAEERRGDEQMMLLGIG